MKAELIGVPEVKPRRSVPGQEVSERSSCGRVADRAGGGKEDRMVLQRDPLHFVSLGRRGPARVRFRFLEVDAETHFISLFSFELWSCGGSSSFTPLPFARVEDDVVSLLLSFMFYFNWLLVFVCPGGLVFQIGPCD